MHLIIMNDENWKITVHWQNYNSGVLLLFFFQPVWKFCLYVVGPDYPAAIVWMEKKIIQIFCSSHSEKDETIKTCYDFIDY